jgi:hypothetical protein
MARVPNNAVVVFMELPFLPGNNISILQPGKPQA